MSEPKRFEDWEEVDCNDCARYWDSSCDAVKEGTQKLCNSYLATRSMVIPAQIKFLTNVVRGLVFSVFIIISVLIIMILGG